MSSRWLRVRAAADACLARASISFNRPFGGSRRRTMSLSLFATATLLLATAAPAAGAELDPAAPLPGYWELANTWVFVFHFRSVQRKCFSGADISGVLRGPSNGHYTCSYPVREVGDGR